MKITRLLLVFVVFVVCLLTGLLLGTSAGQAALLRAASAVPDERQAAASGGSRAKPAGGQKAVLLIGVDRLESADHRLESVWLASSRPPFSELTLQPVYPAQGSDLAAAFRLSPEFAPDPAFLQALQDAGYAWDSYAILDEIGLAELLQLIGGSQAPARTGGAPGLASLPHPWEDPLGALKAQTALMVSLCASPIQFSGPQDIGHIYELLSHHLASDYDPAQLYADWMALHPSGNLTVCRFKAAR